MQVAGLFSGIGGLELPFRRRGVESSLLCDIWEPSQSVLSTRLMPRRMHDDVATLKQLPSTSTIVTAGFPCTDLSQTGRTSGIRGSESGLVGHVFRLLRESPRVEWLVLENVRNMLVLDKGEAMRYLTSELESLGFRWAYRLVDSRFSGVPQRRHRVLLVASRQHDPEHVLFAEDSKPRDDESLATEAYGFYWTEGLRGIGWARDAIPPLKGGSGLGIPSPPAVWIPSAPAGRRLVTPTIEDAEALQGFRRGWTLPAETGKSNGPRWKLVGNAVTVGVADWLVGNLLDPGEMVLESRVVDDGKLWPKAAFGSDGTVNEVEASEWPRRNRYKHLLDVIRAKEAKPLSHRATAGFLSRAERSSLRFDPNFILDVKRHVAATDATG